MITRLTIVIVSFLILCLGGSACGGDLDDLLRAAQSDVTVLCAATDAQYIQWSALLYLQQTYGAEIHIALLQPSPLFGFRSVSTADGQFHLAYIGRGMEVDNAALADFLISRMFADRYPDLAIYEAGTVADSEYLDSILSRIRQVSQEDSISATKLEKVYFRVRESAGSDVILNDLELYRRYSAKMAEIDGVFAPHGPMQYKPGQYRYYRLTASGPGAGTGQTDFIAGFDTFRLPDMIASRLHDGPEKRNLLDRLSKFRSHMRAAGRAHMSAADRLRLLISAYGEITRITETLEAHTGPLTGTGINRLGRIIGERTLAAIKRLVGVEWQGNLEIRETPFGKSGKLHLDVNLDGPLPVELSYFMFHPPGRDVVVVDSISRELLPHQRFRRQYPVDLAGLSMDGFPGDSLLFSVEAIIEGLALDLYVASREYGNDDISIRFLPGYAFLTPFADDQYTALAQPFDWQLLITKPFGRKLEGRLEIETPEGIVVGSYEKDVSIDEDVTSKYINIYLAAGRSIGYDLRRVEAVLTVDGVEAAGDGADVRIIRCEIPDTRSIAFVPDSQGCLEDFLRMARVSFQPFTPRSLMRAPLEAYDLLIIGTDPDGFTGIWRGVRDRIRQYVRDGGEVLVLGQSFGWPGDIFDFSLFTSRSDTFLESGVKNSSHSLLTAPYIINTEALLSRSRQASYVYPAIMGAGTEIVSAGEHASYLKVSQVGSGHVIYCGLPLLELAAALDVDAIHLLANLMQFGHGH